VKLVCETSLQNQFLIKELEFNKSGILEKGCMIILTKESEKINIEIVDQKITNKLTKYNWKMQ